MIGDPNFAFRIGSIFSPDAAKRRQQMTNGRLVHYTTAENALKIIQSRNVWMRNTKCMNDYMEVEYGFDRLTRFFAVHKQIFFASLEPCAAGVAEEAVKLFDDYLDRIRAHTYIACISEHLSSEDDHGRLSMWRAYGSRAVGVALVVNSAPFMSTSDALRAWSSPVSYMTEEEFHREMTQVIENIRSEQEYLRSITRAQLIGAIYNMLLFHATCSKHPGFAEEREYRVIHTPKISPSALVTASIQTIGGVPQNIYKIPLMNFPHEGLSLEIPIIVNRVIIGPSDYPIPIYDAFVDELQRAGMTDAASRVVISNIPLRTASH